MTLKRPLLAMIAAVLLFSFYVWDRHHSERSAFVALQGGQVFFQKPEDARELEFVNATGRVRVTKESDGAWWMTEPVRARADRAIINAYLENLRGAKRQAEIPSPDLADFGLDKPLVTVRIATLDDAGKPVERELQFGRQPGANTNVFARLADEGVVFTVSEWFFRQSAKTAESLRDKTFNTLEATALKSLRVINRRDQFELVRVPGSGTDWALLRPGSEAIPGDRTIIERGLNNIAAGRFLTIEDTVTSTTLQLGLDDPLVTIASDGVELLRVGNRVPGREQFIARAGNVTGTIQASLVADFFRSATEWGTKKFLTFAKDDITTITTTAGNTSMQLFRDGVRGWIFADASETALRKDAMVEFLDAVLAFSATGMAAPKLAAEEWPKFGLVDGAFRLVATTANGRSQAFRIGRTDTREGITYVLREFDGSLWKADFRQQVGVYRFRKDLLEKRIIPDLSDRVAKVEIEAGGHVMGVEKSGTTWRAVQPGLQPVPVPYTMVAGFINGMQALEIDAEIAGAVMAPPVTTFRFFATGEKDAFATMELLSRNKKTGVAMFRFGKRIIEVSSAQFGAFDEEMYKFVLAIRQEGEKKSGSGAPPK